MSAADLVLVTIVAEKILESRLEKLILGAGASGYTVTEARGEGSRHVGSHTFEGQNVRIEVVASDQVAERILEQVTQHYFPHYGVIVYTTAVRVLRGEKYVGE